MAKGVEKDALANSGKANALSDQFNKYGTESFNQLFPFLQGELTNPQGLNPMEMAQLQTEGGQATAGALGTQRALAMENGARTGNTASIPAIIAAGGRQAMQQQSQNAMDVSLKNDALKRQEQQSAAGQLQGLYGTSAGDALSALGISNQALDAASKAKMSNPWMSVLGQAIQAGGQVASAYAAGGGDGGDS